VIAIAGDVAFADVIGLTPSSILPVGIAHGRRGGQPAINELTPRHRRTLNSITSGGPAVPIKFNFDKEDL